MENPRPTILHRPISASPSKHNQESADIQYEREQAKLEQAARRREAVDSQRMKWMHSNADDKSDLQ